MLPVMQVGRVRPGAPPEHDVLHPVGGGLGQARPTNNIGIHGRLNTHRFFPFLSNPGPHRLTRIFHTRLEREALTIEFQQCGLDQTAPLFNQLMLFSFHIL
ncbi:MAG: hypothetical protein FJ404_03755 [Verrucomicrobia bacterium]|nr:hypothetical protein [Verrucomicrobiota bacterium]